MNALQPLRVRISENNALPWARTHEYINLCRTVRQPGDPAAYNPAHPQGASPTDVTQFQVGLANSSITNLPDVFYQLWPSKEWWDHTRSARPLPKRDIHGNIIYERTPRQWAPRELLDYPILRNLDTISSEEEPWFLELLVRMDGRIEWTDLLMRMEYPGTTEMDEQKFRNRLQQRMARSREKFSMVSWRDTAGENNSVRDRVLSTLSPAQLAARGGLGSTRGSTPGSTDSQGKVVPIPGRRPRGTRNTTNVVTQQQQQQPQSVTSVGSSGGASQQQPYQPAAQVGFIGIDSYRNQPSPSSCASPSPRATSPITGGQRHPHAASRPSPQSWSSVSDGVNGYIQYVGDPNSTGARSFNGSSRPNNPYAGFMSGKYVKRGASAVEATPVDLYTPSVSNSSSAGGSDDGDVEDEWIGEDDRSEDGYDSEESYGSLESQDGEENSGSEESYDSYDSDDCEDDDNSDGDDCYDGNGRSDEYDQRPKNYESDNGNDVEMLPANVGHRDDGKRAQERWKWERYLERDRTAVYSYLDGHITREELFLDIEQNRAQLKASLKRARDEISDDDEVEEMQSPRIKRNRRGGKSLPEKHLPTSSSVRSSPPESLGEHSRQNGLVHTSRHPARAIGSAVERLHHVRARRPAPRATIGQEENLKSVNYHRHFQESQHSGTQSNPIDLSREETHGPPHQTHSHKTPRYIQDDPFFSDELFNGMATGRPTNNKHIGNIYTRSQQFEHDSYYERLLTPLTTTNYPQHPPPQPSRIHQPPSAFTSALQDPNSDPYPHPHIPYNIPLPPAQDAPHPPPAPPSNNDPELDFGNICNWNHDWYAFAIQHDAGALLKAHLGAEALREEGGEANRGVSAEFELPD